MAFKTEHWILGIILLLLLWGAFVYKPISQSTLNNTLPQGTCYTGWNGQCTDTIKDACCAPVRECNNQIVDNPLECFTYYCWDANDCCYPTAVVEDDQIPGAPPQHWTCACKDIENVIPN